MKTEHLPLNTNDHPSITYSQKHIEQVPLNV